MLPEGWESTKLGKIMDFRNGLNFSKSDSKNLIKVVGVSDFSLGNVLSRADSLKETYVDQFKDDDLLIENDFLFVRSNGNKSLIGRCLYFPYVPEPISFSGFTIRGRLKGCSISANYIFQIVAGEYFRKHINLSGSGTNISNLSQEILSNTPLILPPLPEQKKIAAILSTWDRAIEGLGQLLANSQQQKTALMQQLLTGKKRLPGFTGEWNIRKFQDLFHERTETDREDLPLLSVTANDGVIFQEDSGRKNISKEDKSKYKRICVGDIGYNTMRMWQGRSCLSDKEGIVSPAYTIVFAKKDICTIFASYLFKFSPLIHVFYRHSQGLVSDTWNLKFKHFKEISWKIPPLPEQKAIAAVLSTADEEITAIESDLSRLCQEKKALMQQLLTGKRRVKVD